MRASAITSADKALICVSLQASAVALRCVAAGLRSAESALRVNKATRKHKHPSGGRRKPPETDKPSTPL